MTLKRSLVCFCPSLYFSFFNMLPASAETVQECIDKGTAFT